MSMYRSIPEIVEARQLIVYKDVTETIDAAFALAKWCNGIFDVVDLNIMLWALLPQEVYVEHEGWIIKDSDGNFYPCSDKDFKRKYEEIVE